MKVSRLAVCCLALAHSLLLSAQDEPFNRSVLNTRPPGTANDYRLAHPFEILYGPDNYLYITEKPGRVLRVDTGTGIRQVILDIRSQVHLNITRNGSGGATQIGQNGMMGMALHPGFGQGTGQDSVFIAYTRYSGNVRISRFIFNSGPTPSLTGETVLIQGLPASNDHSSGRLIVGADNKLYYSCGDLGHNQFGNRCQPIRAQDDPSAYAVANENYQNYSGKILRINFDGSIPADNPVFGGVRSHVYTKGHRNPQGLVWEKTPSGGFSFPAPEPGGKLFSAEHGPRTDDEINILEAGKNYGWPYIAGDSDNVHYQYVNWSSAAAYDCNHTGYTENAIPPGATVTQEKDAPAGVKADFRKPIFSMFPTCGTHPSGVCDAAGIDWMRFPTVAPSSIDYYHVNAGLGIPDWYPSLLVPTLRRGVLYRIKLNAGRDGVESDTIPYFTEYNRFRDIALSPDGLKIYIITDSIGSTSGPSGGGTSTLSDRGAILVYEYLGSVLAMKDDRIRRNTDYNINIYPNPAREVVNVGLQKGVQQPVHYVLLDLTGRPVLSGSTTKASFALAVANLPRGVYTLKLTNGFGQQTMIRKVILH